MICDTRSRPRDDTQRQHFLGPPSQSYDTIHDTKLRDYFHGYPFPDFATYPGTNSTPGALAALRACECWEWNSSQARFAHEPECDVQSYSIRLGIRPEDAGVLGKNFSGNPTMRTPQFRMSTKSDGIGSAKGICCTLHLRALAKPKTSL